MCDNRGRLHGKVKNLGKTVMDRYYSRQGGGRYSIYGEWWEQSLREEKEHGTFYVKGYVYVFD